MKFYYFPLSSYSQKTMMALYEKGVAFEPIVVNLGDPAAHAEYAEKINVFGKVPTLVVDGRHIPESSIIIEYVDSYYPDAGPRLIPADRDLGRQARYFDRFFDLYVNEPMTKIFFDGRKPEADRDPKGVAAAKATLETAYKLLDGLLEKNTWAVGEVFTIADCSAAPALAYARMFCPLDKYKHLSAYANRVAERPSFVRVMTHAAPYFAAMQAK